MARILVVDDDPSILALQRILLSEDEHEVLLMSTARHALEALRLYDFDLLIVDIMMPELNGFQLVNQLKNNSQSHDIPVAFVTARTDPHDIVRAGKLGADFYITKPIDPEIYTRKIQHFFTKNPPKQYSKVNFLRPSPVEVRVFFAGQVCAVSELGIEILTESIFELDQVIEISAALFSEIPMKQPLMRVLSVKPVDHGMYRVHLMFQDLDRNTVLKIQRWIAYNRIKSRKTG